MSSSRVRTLEVAQEATFGNVDATTGLPSTQGLTFTAMTFELASMDSSGGGELPVIEDGQSHASFFGLPPEAGVPWAGNAPLNRREGTITIKCDIRGPQSGASGLTKLWESAFAGTAYEDFNIYACTASGAGNKTLKFTTNGLGLPSPPKVGDACAAIVNGCLVFNRVTTIHPDNGGDTLIDFELAWPDTPAGVYFTELQFKCLTGSQSGATGPSVCIRLKTLRSTAIAYGCRLQSLTIEPAESGVLMATMEMRCPFISYDILGADQVLSEAVREPSPPASIRGAALRVSTDLVHPGQTEKLDAKSMPHEVSGWSLSIAFDLTPIGGGCILGLSELEQTGATIEFSFTSNKVDDFDEGDRLLGNMRALAFGGGPLQYHALPLFSGWGASIPAAYLADQHDVEVGGDVLSQTRKYRAAIYHGASDGDPNFTMFLGGGVV